MKEVLTLLLHTLLVNNSSFDASRASDNSSHSKYPFLLVGAVNSIKHLLSVMAARTDISEYIHLAQAVTVMALMSISAGAFLQSISKDIVHSDRIKALSVETSLYRK